MQAEVKSVMAAGRTPSADGTWTASTFALSDELLGFNREGSRGWQWLRLTDVVSLDQVGTEDDGRLELEFTLADGSTLLAQLPASYVDKLVDALRRSRIVVAAPDATETAAPTAPAADEVVSAPSWFARWRSGPPRT